MNDDTRIALKRTLDILKGAAFFMIGPLFVVIYSILLAVILPTGVYLTIMALSIGGLALYLLFRSELDDVRREMKMNDQELSK